MPIYDKMVFFTDLAYYCSTTSKMQPRSNVGELHDCNADTASQNTEILNCQGMSQSLLVTNKDNSASTFMNNNNNSCDSATVHKESKSSKPSTSRDADERENQCNACKQIIKDRYLLKAVDKYWHEDCLKCSCCDCRLGEVGCTLFTKAGLLLCRRDYLRFVPCKICNNLPKDLRNMILPTPDVLSTSVDIALRLRG